MKIICEILCLKMLLFLMLFFDEISEMFATKKDNILQISFTEKIVISPLLRSEFNLGYMMIQDVRCDIVVAQLEAVHDRAHVVHVHRVQHLQHRGHYKRYVQN